MDHVAASQAKPSALRGLAKRAQIALTRQPRLYHATRRGTELVKFAMRRPHDPDFEAFGLFPDRTGLMLDVGANSRTSALSFRLANKVSPIPSIEANPAHEPARRVPAVGPVLREHPAHG